VKVIPLLQGPLPEALTSRSTTDPRRDQRPLETIDTRRPASHSLPAPGERRRMRPPELSSTQSMYCVALATGVPAEGRGSARDAARGRTRLAAAARRARYREGQPVAQGPLPEALDVTTHH